jgi:hypothetical protein
LRLHSPEQEMKRVPIGCLVVLITIFAHSQSLTAQVTDAGIPAHGLAEIASRVRSSETIYVQTVNGEEITGRFVRVSTEALIVETQRSEREIPAGNVRTVAKRGGSRARQGMAYGFIGGALLADIAVITSSSDDKGVGLFVGTLAGGGAGLLWGGVVGAFYHKRLVVYPASAPAVHLIPVLAPGRAGLMLSAGF